MRPIHANLAGVLALVITIAGAQGQQQTSTTQSAPGTAAKAPAEQSKPFIKLQGTEVQVAGLPPVTFHGFVSQGYLYSQTYNYLDPETTEGSAKFFEAGVNASFNPFPRTRIAAQAFSFDVGKAGEYDVVLDYALAEYTVADWLGVRGGRLRRPEGLYNDIQDLDMARTWVLLPQGMYPARWRDMYTSQDGVELFGTIPLSVAGSLSYQLYSGFQRPQLNGGLALQKEALAPFLPLVDINSPNISGTQLWWNTPLNGLRFGAAVNYDRDISFHTSNKSQTRGSPFVQRYSLDYSWNNWTFQAEYFTYDVQYNVTRGDRLLRKVHIQPDSWYASAAYRFNKWLEVGTYYTEYYQDVHNHDGVGLAVPSDASQKDVALTVRIDPTPWWILKVEGHHINGTGQLYDNVANPVRHSDGWWMLALKTTFSF